MRRAVVVFGVAALVMGACEVARPPMAFAAALQRPNLDLARTAFAALSSDDRLGLHLRLMAGQRCQVNVSGVATPPSGTLPERG